MSAAIKRSRLATISGFAPQRVTISTNADGKFETVHYYYAVNTVYEIAARGLDLAFRNGALNAWVYISAFDEDRTIIELASSNKIRKGASSRGDVQAALGKPYGKALCPSLLYTERCKAAETWAWGTFKSGKIQGRAAWVYFDNKGTVRQVDTVQANQ